jgi:hypothetical protein
MVVGMLYRTKFKKRIYTCVDVVFAHVATMTMVCIENGDRWVITGLRNFEKYFEPLTQQEEK